MAPSHPHLHLHLHSHAHPHAYPPKTTPPSHPLPPVPAPSPVPSTVPSPAPAPVPPQTSAAAPRSPLPAYLPRSPLAPTNTSTSRAHKRRAFIITDYSQPRPARAAAAGAKRSPLVPHTESEEESGCEEDGSESGLEHERKVDVADMQAHVKKELELAGSRREKGKGKAREVEAELAPETDTGTCTEEGETFLCSLDRQQIQATYPPRAASSCSTSHHASASASASASTRSRAGSSKAPSQHQDASRSGSASESGPGAAHPYPQHQHQQQRRAAFLAQPAQPGQRHGAISQSRSYSSSQSSLHSVLGAGGNSFVLDCAGPSALSGGDGVEDEDEESGCVIVDGIYHERARPAPKQGQGQGQQQVRKTSSQSRIIRPSAQPGPSGSSGGWREKCRAREPAAPPLVPGYASDTSGKSRGRGGKLRKIPAMLPLKVLGVGTSREPAGGPSPSGTDDEGDGTGHGQRAQGKSKKRRSRGGGGGSSGARNKRRSGAGGGSVRLGATFATPAMAAEDTGTARPAPAPAPFRSPLPTSAIDWPATPALIGSPAPASVRPSAPALAPAGASGAGGVGASPQFIASTGLPSFLVSPSSDPSLHAQQQGQHQHQEPQKARGRHDEHPPPIPRSAHGSAATPTSAHQSSSRYPPPSPSSGAHNPLRRLRSFRSSPTLGKLFRAGAGSSKRRTPRSAGGGATSGGEEEEEEEEEDAAGPPSTGSASSRFSSFALNALRSGPRRVSARLTRTASAPDKTAMRRDRPSYESAPPQPPAQVQAPTRLSHDQLGPGVGHARFGTDDDCGRSSASGAMFGSDGDGDGGRQENLRYDDMPIVEIRRSSSLLPRSSASTTGGAPAHDDGHAWHGGSRGSSAEHTAPDVRTLEPSVTAAPPPTPSRSPIGHFFASQPEGMRRRAQLRKSHERQQREQRATERDERDRRLWQLRALSSDEEREAIPLPSFELERSRAEARQLPPDVAAAAAEAGADQQQSRYTPRTRAKLLNSKVHVAQWQSNLAPPDDQKRPSAGPETPHTALFQTGRVILPDEPPEDQERLRQEQEAGPSSALVRAAPAVPASTLAPPRTPLGSPSFNIFRRFGFGPAAPSHSIPRSPRMDLRIADLVRSPYSLAKASAAALRSGGGADMPAAVMSPVAANLTPPAIEAAIAGQGSTMSRERLAAVRVSLGFELE